MVVTALAALAFLWMLVRYRSEFPQPDRQLYDAYTRMNKAGDRLAKLESENDSASAADDRSLRSRILKKKRELSLAAREKARIKSTISAYFLGMLTSAMLGLVSTALLLRSIVLGRKNTANHALDRSAQKRLS